MAKKIQLQDANGNVLHPLTLGECVTMSNGENLDTLMSKSQMFTPTITQDKSMFKVGTGVDVDYSANVKDGAYESLVFKGKSLVNLITSGEMRAIANGGWVFANSNIRVDMLKPLTDYTLITYVLQNTLSGGSGFAVGKDGGTANGLPFCSLKIPSGEVGIYKLKMRTQSEITGNTGLRQQIYNNVASGQIVFKQVLLEGDYTTRDIPYFTGLCDSKMPILRNVGKNLFDVNLLKGLNSNVVVTDGIVTMNNAYSNGLGVNGKKAFWFLKPNKTYRYSCAVTNTGESNGLDGGFYFGKRLGDGTTTFFSIYPNTTVTIPSDWENYTTVIMYGAMSNNGLVTVKNMQFEEADATTSYEDHKTNILRTSEEIVLREVNGVQDTYNAITGEYVKRIGEIVLDGSESEWHKYSNNTNEYNTTDKTSVFSISINDKKLGYHTSICDTFRNTNNNYAFNMSYVEPFTYSDHPTNTSCYFDYGNNNSYTVADFKTWLSQNPVTIQYELAEPVTTIVKPSTMTPFAYQNGHVIVESGFEGQSLLPEIEYSVVTGRTGQVTQNTKVLRKQEQQIIGLEELLLTQVVQMEYERTLLQFDYELQMMMLG